MFASSSEPQPASVWPPVLQRWKNPNPYYYVNPSTTTPPVPAHVLCRWHERKRISPCCRSSQDTLASHLENHRCRCQNHRGNRCLPIRLHTVGRQMFMNCTDRFLWPPLCAVYKYHMSLILKTGLWFQCSWHQGWELYILKSSVTMFSPIHDMFCSFEWSHLLLEVYDVFSQLCLCHSSYFFFHSPDTRFHPLDEQCTLHWRGRGWAGRSHRLSLVYTRDAGRQRSQSYRDRTWRSPGDAHSLKALVVNKRCFKTQKGEFWDLVLIQAMANC